MPQRRFGRQLHASARHVEKGIARGTTKRPYFGFWTIRRRVAT